MAWDNNKIKELMNKGITNASHADLINAYKFVSGENYKGGCSACFKRRAQRAIINYYNKL